MPASTPFGGVPMSDEIHRVARVVEARREGRAGATLITDGALPAEPGQFAMVWLPGIEERPYTIVDDHPLTFAVAQVGPFSAALAALAPEDRLWVRGPYGHGFRLAGRRHLLIGGGSGAAPLVPLARRARMRGDDVTVILGAQSADLFMLAWGSSKTGCRPSWPPMTAAPDSTGRRWPPPPAPCRIAPTPSTPAAPSQCCAPWPSAPARWASRAR